MQQISAAINYGKQKRHAIKHVYTSQISSWLLMHTANHIELFQNKKLPESNFCIECRVTVAIQLAK